jgi:predicted dehydrogenase
MSARPPSTLRGGPQPTLRLGVLGCAAIAQAFARHLAGSTQARIVAVASRELAKAQAFAASHQVERAWGSYEALLADPAVDAVYIPLPNSLHAYWAVRAAEAGKHVLCEKPLTLDLASAEAMFSAARRHGVMLLESYPWWFQPQTRDMLENLRSDDASGIGPVQSVQASFGFTLAEPVGNIRFDPALGGGALLDAGSYPLSFIRLVMGSAPEAVRAEATWAANGVDLSTSATLFYADGRRAQMACAMAGSAYHRHASIVGQRGTLYTDYANHTAEQLGHPMGFHVSPMRVRRGVPSQVPFVAVHSATGSGFRFAAEAFARVVAAQDHAAIERAAQASLDIAATLEAIAQAARNGQTVKLPARTCAAA